MLGIRKKLLLGFGGLLLSIAIIGTLTMMQIAYLSQAIEVMLRENYRSIVACQEMKESLERMDSGVLFSFADEKTEGQNYIEENTHRFRAALKIELGNITLPGEQAKADGIRDLFEQYSESLLLVTSPDRSLEERKQAYFEKVLPVFQEIKGLTQHILEKNQANIHAINDRVRLMAASARRRIFYAILICTVIGALFIFFIQQWILKPINKLMASTDEIRKGNLDLVLDTHSRNEIGRLSESFNEMVSALRQTRKQNQLDFLRTKNATEEVFKALPAAIAILDLNGIVQMGTETAQRHFGMKPGVSIQELSMDWLPGLVDQAVNAGILVEGNGENRRVQQFVEGR
jgi:nitrogen fixation/metabolism regulation signal transduction histidine kinase